MKNPIHNCLVVILLLSFLVGCASNGVKYRNSYDVTVKPPTDKVAFVVGDVDVDLNMTGTQMAFLVYGAIYSSAMDLKLKSDVGIIAQQEFKLASLLSNSSSVAVTPSNGKRLRVDLKVQTANSEQGALTINVSLIEPLTNILVYRSDYTGVPDDTATDQFKSAIAHGIRAFIYDESAYFALGVSKRQRGEQEIKVVYKERAGNGGNQEILVRKKFLKENNLFNYKKNTTTHDNSYALIVGINEYKENNNVEFADYSALAFEELAIKTLGIPKENIITLINSEATSGQLKSKIQLIKELPDQGGKLFVFFAGHGVPGKDANVYLLPSDMSADAIHLEPNLRVDNIYKTLVTSEASEVFVFLDSCFSGKDDNGDLLYRGVAPVLKVNTVAIPKEKLTVMTAGKSTDFANDFADKKHRLFSYYLINELANGQTNLQELYNTIRSKVKRNSLQKGIGYKQVPDFFGDTGKNIL